MALANSVTAAGLAVDGNTIASTYRQRIEISKDQRAYLVKKAGEYSPVVWKDIHQRVLGVYQSMRKLGVNRGDRVSILSQTCPRWNITDLSILTSGAVTVPIYPSNTPEDAAFILQNSQAKLLFVEDEKALAHAVQIFKALGKELPVVSFTDETIQSGDLSAIGFEEFASCENEQETQKDWEKATELVQATDVASIVYTSGTTGKPKGVVLTHSNFTSGIRAVIDEIELTVNDKLLTFLPLAHIFGRIESLAPIFSGITMAFAEDISTVAQNIQEVKPTILVSVPRIYEKIYTKILSGVESGSPVKQKIFFWAKEIGCQVARLRSEKKPIPLSLTVKYEIADKLVFSKIREKLGGNIKLTASGGAPLSQDICEFFHACGIKILEGYGLTETLGPILVNHPDDYRFGTVGTPIGTSEVKIADDGEILLRGPMVFKEYFLNEEATKEAFTEDGWFCSGDIGELDSRGFLKITDRKKELIVTAGGKNIAPQKLENLLKLSPFISNCMAYGDKQKYITALVTLNEEAVSKWADTNGLEGKDMAALAKEPKIVELINKELAQANKKLASYESVKKVAIVPSDWTTETGELTPSLKLKRKIVINKYQDYIQGLY